jgi:hypothetical protein
MRDECLRVAQSLQSAAPSIVPGAQTSSGAGVGAAVFPPVDQSAPAPGPVQTPYQPGPYGPATPAPSYGYPQQGGYQPPPQTSAYAPQQATAYSAQQGTSTPPPYSITPQRPGPAAGGSGGGKSNKGIVVGSILVALIAIGGLITALTLNNNSDDDKGADKASASASASVAGHKGPDTTKTVETTACTEPDESYDDPDKIQIPSFVFKNLTSVKACLRAAGWQYKIKDVNENTYGEDTVMDQYPAADTDVDPKDMPEIQLNVSTGDPA